MGGYQVSIPALVEAAGDLDTTADELAVVDPGSPLADAAGAVPGSDTARAATDLAGRLDEAVRLSALGVRDLAATTESNRRTYERTDEDAGRGFDRTFGGNGQVR